MVEFKPEDFGVEDCKVCGDIQNWVEKVKNSAFDERKPEEKDSKEDIREEIDDKFWKPYPEPPDSLELGQNTWGFLHVMY